MVGCFECKNGLRKWVLVWIGVVVVGESGEKGRVFVSEDEVGDRNDSKAIL